MNQERITAQIREFETFLGQGAKKINVALTDHQVSLLSVHARELLLWNQKINLTAITRPLEMAEKHFIDALAVRRFICPAQRILDMGSGGGFPGIPLKVVLPDTEFCLVDASRKKVNFLKHVIRTLGLPQIQALHSRVEDLGQAPEHAGRYDGVISRGFADLEKFVDLALPFLKPGGIVYAMKGKAGVEEISLGLRDRFSVFQEVYQLPLLQSDRSMIRLEPKNLPDGF